MRKLRSRLLGVENGSVMLFSDYQHDGVMWTGESPREFRKVIEFDEPFSSAPMVQVGLSLWILTKLPTSAPIFSPKWSTPKALRWCFAHGVTHGLHARGPTGSPLARSGMTMTGCWNSR